MQFDFNAYWIRIEEWLLTDGIRTLLIVIATLVAFKAIGALTHRIEALLLNKHRDAETQKRAGTLSHVLRWFLRVLIVAVAAIMLLQQFGLPVGPALTAAGVAGVALGFGAQNMVQDFLAGFFILLEDQIRVGDVVQINDKSGVVEQLNLRMVVLRDYAGNVIYLRNGKIDVVTNMTKDYSYYVFNVGVAYREDVDEVIHVLKTIDEEIRRDPTFQNDILAPLEVAGVDSFADSAVVIKARIKTRPMQQWRVGREFNRRIKKKFDERGIEMPYPHRTIYFGADKQGQAPSVQVEIKNRPGPHD